MSYRNDADAGTVVLTAIFLVAVIILILGLIFTLAWNVGIVALLGAVGISAGKIGVVQGVFGYVGLCLLGGIFRSPNVKTKE